MPVIALAPGYEDHIEIRDAEKNFHGNIIVYVHWEEHISFCAALTFPLPPDMSFGALISEVIAPHYAAHPDAAHVDWDKVQWKIDGKAVTPDLSTSLRENGVGHKSLIRFWTPGLNGYKGTGM